MWMYTSFALAAVVIFLWFELKKFGRWLDNANRTLDMCKRENAQLKGLWTELSKEIEDNDLFDNPYNF